MAFKPNYRQWSGYLMASPGTFLHYWWVDFTQQSVLVMVATSSLTRPQSRFDRVVAQ
jgi:hypothetical protein